MKKQLTEKYLNEMAPRGTDINRAKMMILNKIESVSDILMKEFNDRLLVAKLVDAALQDITRMSWRQRV